MTSDFSRLIFEHRSGGLLIDSNLSLLYLVGIANPRRIQAFKRTQKYTPADFDLLLKIAGSFARFVTTAPVLAEVSNLASLHGSELRRFRAVFREHVVRATELSASAREVTDDPLFSRLGFTDAAIGRVALEGPVVLTDNLDLYLALSHRGTPVINFNHLRPLAW